MVTLLRYLSCLKLRCSSKLLDRIVCDNRAQETRTGPWWKCENKKAEDQTSPTSPLATWPLTLTLAVGGVLWITLTTLKATTPINALLVNTRLATQYTSDTSTRHRLASHHETLLRSACAQYCQDSSLFGQNCVATTIFLRLSSCVPGNP